MTPEEALCSVVHLLTYSMWITYYSGRPPPRRPTVVVSSGRHQDEAAFEESETSLVEVGVELEVRIGI